jgi:transposase
MVAEQEPEQAEEPAELVARAAAIDVAKDSGMVCTRVPHESRSGRRVQEVRDVTARFAAVTELADHLVCEGIERVVLEATSDYWRIWFYLPEAAGLQVWLVSARDVKNVPGRPKTDKLDSIWLCKLNERGMLRPSFVPPEEIRDLRALTRLRATLTAECSRHKQRAEKILEDALVKVSAVVSDLFGKSGRAMMRALVAGERDPKVLAGLALGRLRPEQAQLAGALTGRFRDVRAYEIGLLLDLVETLEARITELDAKIEAHLAALPGVPPACASCGLIGGGHAPAAATTAPGCCRWCSAWMRSPGPAWSPPRSSSPSPGWTWASSRPPGMRPRGRNSARRPSSPAPEPGRAGPGRATGGCAAPSATPRWPPARPTPTSGNAAGG